MPFSSLGCVGISYKWFLLPKAGKFGNWPPEPSGERDYRKDFWEKNRAWHRSVHLPRRVFAKPENLFQVMLPMHQMKLSPLRRTQRPRIGWSSSWTLRPKRASHCAMIASIATILAPISFRTSSAGKPFGNTIAGALRPAGM